MAKGDVSTYNVDGVWKSKGEGSARAAHTGGTKAQQTAMGRKMAQKRKVEHTIRKLAGTIGEKNSYGNDPNPPRADTSAAAHARSAQETPPRRRRTPMPVTRRPSTSAWDRSCRAAHGSALRLFAASGRAHAAVAGGPTEAHLAVPTGARRRRRSRKSVVPQVRAAPN
jgi:Uncharacterized protein conserved in bacteria (DUF2188)